VSNSLRRNLLRSAQLVLVVLGTSLFGCTSSEPSREVSERMRALGTWAYQATGVNSIRQGRLKIKSRDGDLIGQFHDRVRGKVLGDVRVRGAYMEIRIDQLRITGRILNNQYSGTVKQSDWDVTRQNPRRQSQARFEARRIRRQGESDTDDDFGCPALLREASYACSPLRPQ